MASANSNTERKMNNTGSIHRTLSLALAFTGGLIASNIAVAQNSTEEVIIRAPLERTEVTSSPGSIVKTEIVELSRYVRFSDLDLTRPEDVAELDSRIEDIAEDSCQKLSDMFPLDRSNRAEMNRCVRKAIASATERKEYAIAVGH
jgi:UrcA family protein